MPVTHRPPLPVLILNAMVSLALAWGWTRWAALTSLAYHGAMRIGEPLKAARQDLLLPRDAGLNEPVLFLRVGSPKPGRRGKGRIQHARISDELCIRLADYAFGNLAAGDSLYPVSPSTYRRRWDHLLATLKIPKTLQLTPGSLRGGGACHWYHLSVPIVDVLWRMRLRQVATLEHYLQESAAANMMMQLPQQSKKLVQSSAALLPFIAQNLFSKQLT